MNYRNSFHRFVFKPDMLQGRQSNCIITVNTNETNIQENIPNAVSASVKTDQLMEKKYGIGITGMDRLSLPNYNRKAKMAWIVSYFIFSIAAFWESKHFLHEYLYGLPAVTVTFEKLSKFIIPELAMCPTKMTGSKDVTNALRKKYQHYFKLSDEEMEQVVFSDFLRLPNETMDTLWNFNDYIQADGMNVSSSLCFLLRDGNIECSPNIPVFAVAASSGSCLSSKDGRISDSIGIENSNKLLWVKIQSNIKAKQHASLAVGRIYPVPYPRDLIYVDKDYGMPYRFSVYVSVVQNFIEIFRLNLPKRPCAEGKEVQCINNCIEQLLYSEVACRLPFMHNYTLPDCNTPDLFNKTVEAVRKIIKKSEKCEDECPPLCFQAAFPYYADINQIFTKNFQLTIRLANPTKTVVKEERWYTFNNLVADVGSCFGGFLDLNFLTTIEIFEMLIEVIYEKWTRRNNTKSLNNKQLNKKCSSKPRISRRNVHLVKKFRANEEYNTINIGLDGFDRILNPHCGKIRKIVWSFCIVLAFATCFYQIYSVIYGYQYDKPDTKLIPQFNKTIKYPALTFCPLRPFSTWNYFEELKDRYNSSNDVALSDLLSMEDNGVLEFWNSSFISKEAILRLDIEAKKFTGQTVNPKEFEVLYNSDISIFGKCMTIDIHTEVKFRGPGTIVMLLIKSINQGEYPLQMFSHSPEDDIRTLNPLLGIPLKTSVLGFAPITIKKIERQDYQLHPCKDSITVAKCKSECFDGTLGKQVSCRLPFMKNETLPICSRAEEFNKTMEIAISFYDKFPENWCDCPVKCDEYIFEMYVEGVAIPMDATGLTLQIPTNMILIIREYRQLNFLSAFNNISGALGLYTGFCILTLVELLECLWILLQRFRN